MRERPESATPERGDRPLDESRTIARVLGQLGAAGLGLPPATPIDDGSTDQRRTLGDITLHPHQRSAVARLQRTMPRFGGALLADDVGLGKTFVALAIARDYTHACVIAPATLRSTWRAAIARARADAAHVHLHSLHAFSRGGPRAERVGAEQERVERERGGRRLVVIDEAHHLRNPATLRYAAIADWCRGAHVLLLTATPVHNHERDLTHLLALFLGRAAKQLRDEDRLRLVVRRHLPDAALPAPPPRLHALPARRVPDVPAITTGILALPAPLPSRDGQAAGALVALGLLRAWCSSAAACLALVQRRRLRATALESALHDGRWPSGRELQTWSLGDDAVQLGFTALLVPESTPSTQPARQHGSVPRAHAMRGPVAVARPDARTLAAAHRTLATHRDALDRLADVLRTHAGAIDRTRVEVLRSIRTAHRHATILAFTQFAETVRALGRLMRWDDGVATLTARGGHVAGGPLPRAELLARVAPVAHGRREPPPHERVRLLITTDLLAEGVNLQDASVVVHLDQPWTPAAIAQREGRIARLGSRHRDVYSCTIEPPGGSAAALALADRLRRKARAAHRALRPEVGAASHMAREVGARPALLAVLQSWYEAGRAALIAIERTPSRGGAVVHTPWCWALTERGARTGWLAAVALGGDTRLYAGWCRGPRARTTASRDPRVVHPIALQVLDALARGASWHPVNTAPEGDHASVVQAPASATPTGVRAAAREHERLAIVRAVRRARDRWRAHALVDTVPAPALRVQRALRTLLQEAPLAERMALAARVGRLATRVRRVRGAGVERALEPLLARVGAPDRRQWIEAMEALLDTEGVSDPPGDHVGASPTSVPIDAAAADGPPDGVLALLLVRV